MVAAVDRGALYVYNYQNYIQCRPLINYLLTGGNRLVATKKRISQFTERRYILLMPPGALTMQILALAIDNDNAVWIGTTKGIFTDNER